MAKNPSGGASIRAWRSPDTTMAREDARPTTKLKPSALVDTRLVYCGDYFR